jgi:hypothetical protein
VLQSVCRFANRRKRLASKQKHFSHLQKEVYYLSLNKLRCGVAGVYSAAGSRRKSEALVRGTLSEHGVVLFAPGDP